ncbi:MAG: IS1595 family transposase [Candidatus Limnocylindrales bacterium]
MSRRPTFTQDLDLVALIEDFGSEDKCRTYLEELRWPDGVRCPRCDSDKISRIVKRHQFDCDVCRYQFSVTAGTIFNDSHLPLWKWFLAVYVMGESKKGISANQLKRMLRVSYKTAWYLCHRIRESMRDDAAPYLMGIVEADETYIGGKHPGQRGGRSLAFNKTAVLGAVERGGEVRFRVTDRVNGKAIRSFLEAVVGDEAEAIYTDQFQSYRGIEDENTRHETVNHAAKQWVQGDVHTNTIEGVWSLFKRGLIGSYHHVSVDHLPAYLDEMAFRYNNRENAYLFRDTLLRLIGAEPMPYAELVAEGA